MAVSIAMVTLTKANVSPLPAWVERYLLLDTGSKSFQAVIKANHHFNNPVFRVACWLLVEDSAYRRTMVGDSRSAFVSAVQLCGQVTLCDEEGVGTPKEDTNKEQKEVDMIDEAKITGLNAADNTGKKVQKRRHSGLGVLRWRLAIMLHHYPQLRCYRAHYLARKDAKKPHYWKQEVNIKDMNLMKPSCGPTSQDFTHKNSFVELINRLLFARVGHAALMSLCFISVNNTNISRLQTPNGLSILQREAEMNHGGDLDQARAAIIDALQVNQKSLHLASISTPPTDKTSAAAHMPREKHPREKHPREKHPREKNPREKNPREKHPREKHPREKHPREKNPREKHPREKKRGSKIHPVAEAATAHTL